MFVKIDLVVYIILTNNEFKINFPLSLYCLKSLVHIRFPLSIFLNCYLTTLLTYFILFLQRYRSRLANFLATLIIALVPVIFFVQSL